MSWIAARDGSAIELVNPVVEQVNWDDIAWSLAHTNRYGGHGEIQVSEALHLLIGLTMASETLRPLWLIHTAYKTRLNDMMSPTKSALVEIAGSLVPDGGAIVSHALAEFEDRHTRIIHAAAGLPLPDVKQKNMIWHIGRRARLTEHLDFHRTGGPEWADLATVERSRNVWRFKQPDKIATDLLDRFRRYLPNVRAGIM